MEFKLASPLMERTVLILVTLAFTPDSPLTLSGLKLPAQHPDKLSGENPWKMALYDPYA
jgi:hypothetical protein